MKRIAILVVVLMSQLHAGICPVCDKVPEPRDPCAAPSVCVKSPAYTFEIMLTPMGLQPIANTDYAAQANPFPLPSPNWRVHSIDTSLAFAFNVGLAAICHERDTNIRANWEYMHANDYASINLPSNEMLGPMFSIGPDASPYTEANGHVMFNFNSWNLDYGLYTKYAETLKTNLFVGVSSIYLKHEITSNFASAATGTAKSVSTPTKYLGFGPQIGVDVSYKIVNHLRLNGEASAALLVGPQFNETHFTATSPTQAGGVAFPVPFLVPGTYAVPVGNPQNTHTTRVIQVVPGFELKLGLAYDYYFGKKGMLSVEAGYNTEVYINAIQSQNMGSEVWGLTPAVDAVGVYARTFQRVLSNFALAGPYGTVNIAF